MIAMAMQTGSTKRFQSNDDRWQAVADRDKTADGKFFYSVRTTGVYCRPSCPGRLARRENVRFHLTSEDAEKAGFRACKRCRPKEGSRENGQAEAVATACRLIEEADQAPDLGTLASTVRMSP